MRLVMRRVFGGYSPAQVFGDVLRYNFTSGLWTRIAMGPDGPVGGLIAELTVQSPRYWHTAVAVGQPILVFGGAISGPHRLTGELWIYAGGRWTAGADGPALASHAAVVVGTRMVVLGGRCNISEYSAHVYQYDTSANNWTRITPGGTVAPRVYCDSWLS